MERYVTLLAGGAFTLLMFVPVGSGQDAATGGLAAEKKGTPKEEASKPEAGPELRYVPERPLDIASRFFELDETQKTSLRALGQKLAEERRKAIAEIDKVLDGKAEPIILTVLSEEQKAEYEKMREAIVAYSEGLKTAEEDFAKAHTELGGPALAYVPNSQYQLLNLVPGITDEEKAASQKVASDLGRQQYQEVGRAMREAKIQRPGRGDREGWQVYLEARRKIQREIAAEHKDETVQKMAAALGPETGKKFTALSKALDTLNVTRDKLKAELGAKLVEIVGSERLKAGVTSGRYGRGGRGDRRWNR